ncbi:MAG: Fic family protein [Spirochaetales bacterium]|nr:Fic family protein [Spirochaetales bacterium]
MNRSGEFVINPKGEASYKSFRPTPLPPDPNIEMNDDMIGKLIAAKTELAKLETASNLIPNAELFISMYVRKEALLSSQIEGTQCTLDDVLDPEVDMNANLDLADVLNYVKAVSFAVDRLNTLPICCRLLREIHSRLMDGIRGSDKNPGEFRRSQNWIGATNCSLSDARYIPPNVEDMNSAMSDLEKYINSTDNCDPLVRCALIHYQFETIHPFLDGNGRVGRMLILLYLLEQKILTKPVIYVSYFLKKNQIEYYDRISEVRRTGNYEQWVAFFIDATAAAAADSYRAVMRMTDLHKTNETALPKTSRTKDTVRMLFDYIERYPIIDIKKTATALHLSYNTVSSAVSKLTELGILKETTNAARNKVFAYNAYLEILREGT